jgi:FMN phosphatase YigB (HAD superfamily)
MKLAIIDFNRTIFDPDTGCLVPGALELLQLLEKKGVARVLVSRLEPGREGILSDFGIQDMFAKIYFVPEKSKDLFLNIMQTHGASSEETLVIGDYLHEEIRYGKRAGARTIHFKKGKFRHLSPESEDDIPWKTVEVLSEIAAYI